jgi:hypothetical protein
MRKAHKQADEQLELINTVCPTQSTALRALPCLNIDKGASLVCHRQCVVTSGVRFRRVRQLKAPLNTCNTCTATHHKPLIHVNAFSKHTFNLGQPVIALLHRPPQVPLQGHGTTRPSAAPIQNLTKSSIIAAGQSFQHFHCMVLFLAACLHASCCARLSFALCQRGGPDKRCFEASSYTHASAFAPLRQATATDTHLRLEPCECVL